MTANGQVGHDQRKAICPKFFDKRMVLLLGLMIVLGLLMMKLGPPDSLDTRLYYSGDEARKILQGFSAKDLEAYFVNEILDLFFVVSYTSALLLGLRRIYKTRVWTILLPLTAGFSDLIETGVIISVLKFSFPQSIFDGLGIFTFLKWIVGAVLILVLVGRLISSVVSDKCQSRGISPSSSS